jgi:type 1 glutamine amidotransferase
MPIQPFISTPMILPRFSYGALFGALLVLPSLVAVHQVSAQVVFEPKDGPAKGKQVVFVLGDDEYFSEEGGPLLARILSERHGFRATLCFATNPETGVIAQSEKTNIPGLEALRKADLMVVFTRFRALKDEQMKEIVDYLDSGRPVIGLRTATHAFAYPKDSTSPYAKYSWNNNQPEFEGGFGRQILGETWVSHWGGHGKQATRGIIAPGAEGHPVTRGIKSGDIYGPTDVYEVRLPQPEGCVPLVLGQVLKSMDFKDEPAGEETDAKSGKTKNKNNPMLPVAWVRTYKGASGKVGRVFASTMGGAMSGKRDWDSEGFRRLFVNAAYWCTGIEEKIPASANVEPVGSTEAFKRGVKAGDALRETLGK